MAKTRAGLEAENEQLRKANQDLTTVVESDEKDKTVAELRAENAKLREVNTQLQTTHTDKLTEATTDAAASGSCPNCGFNAVEYKKQLEARDTATVKS